MPATITVKPISIADVYDCVNVHENGRSAVKSTTMLDGVIAELVEASRAKAAA